MANLKLDKLDKQILKMIAEDARVPFLEVARACNVSGAAIHQRIQKLTNIGVLKGSEFIIDPEKIGYETCAFIGLNLKEPESFDGVVEQLKKHVSCPVPSRSLSLSLKGKKQLPYYAQPYLYNISNDMARDFYRSQGLVRIEPAFELQHRDNALLMQCRHCLRYSLGYCVKHGGRHPLWREPLSLHLGDGRSFQLEFDCKHCQMNVFAGVLNAK